MPFIGFFGSTWTTKYKSLFKENISLDDYESKTATMGIRHLDLFCKRVTDIIL